MDKIVGRLGAIAHRQRGMLVEIGRLLDPLRQLVNGNAAEYLARSIGLAHVALNDPAIRLTHLRDRLARAEVHDLVEFQRFVRLAPPQDWNVQHGNVLL